MGKHKQKGADERTQLIWHVTARAAETMQPEYFRGFSLLGVEDLGWFSSFKRAKKLIEGIVGHKLKWRDENGDGLSWFTKDVVGFDNICITADILDGTFRANFHIPRTMRRVLAQDEEDAQSPIDNFLDNLLDDR